MSFQLSKAIFVKYLKKMRKIIVIQYKYLEILSLRIIKLILNVN